MDIPRFSSTYLSGNSPAISTSSSPSVNGSKNQYPTDHSSYNNFVVFHGDGTGLIMPKSEATDRMQAVLDRLDATSGAYLVSSGLFENEEFLSFTDRMSDADLDNFARTTKALRTPSDQLPTTASYSGMSAIRGLFEDLQTMSGDTMSRVLEKTAELSAPVPAFERKFTYDAKGDFSQGKGSAAATPLHNFVKAVGTMDSADIDEQANNLLDSLELYSENLESTLLQIASADSKIAVEIINQMQDYDEDSQNDVFSYLSKLASSINPSAPPPPATALDREPGEEGWHASILGTFANSKKVVVDMMDTFSSIMKTYEFRDQQITDMTSDLSELDNDNQRAYLEITKTGLSTLLSNAEDQYRQEQEKTIIPNEVLSVVDGLRNQSDVLFFVIESGRGDQKIGQSGQSFYELKGWNSSKKDEAQTIEVLVSDAWFNRDASNSSSLINKLRSLDAGQRDLLVDDLSALNDSGLYHSETEGQDGYQALQRRLEPISNTGDLSVLLAAEENLPSESIENFWKAASFLEQEASDLFANMISRSSEEIAQVLVGLIVSLEESVNHEEMTHEEAMEQAEDILATFSFNSKKGS
jgi:hypothetical protein